MTRPRGQLVLDLGHRAALGREDFLVAPCNRAAVAWIDRWPDWPAPALVLAGPEGCGKTHLAHVWRHRTGAALLLRSALAEGGDPVPEDGARYVVVEDADAPGSEAALFHLYNHIAAHGGTMLLCARMPPARWPIALPDLASRLRAAPVAEIGLPDDSLLEAVLAKLFADRQLRIGAEILRYVVPRMERSFAAARAIVERLDRAALAESRTVTVPLARRVLEEASRDP
jgi:chromosomal replication initiation ATPase DnaA